MERFVPGPVRSARAEVERSLRERLDFEALITDVTARVVAATPETIDAALLEALEELRVAVGADRAVLFEYSEDLSSSFITHVAYRAGVSRVPERVDMRALFPWSNNRIAAGETVIVRDALELPPEAAVDRENLQRLGGRAFLVVPIFPTGGGFRHGHCRVPPDQLDHQAFVPGIEMGNKDESDAAILRHRGEELLEGIQPAGRGAYANYRRSNR